MSKKPQKPDFIDFTTTAIPELNRIRLYDETVQHVSENHPEIPIHLPSIMAAVEKAVQEPSYVIENHSDNFVFVDETSTNKSGDPLHIPVKVVNSTQKSGRIKTLYFAETSSNAKIRKGPVK